MTQKALSVRQPWASLIVSGLKTIEIRSWPTSYRGPLYIPAAKTLDEMGMNRFQLESPPTGALLGTVKVVKVELFTSELWDELADKHLDNGAFLPGLYAWHLEDARFLPQPISYRGDRSLPPVVLENSLSATPI
ncbi:MAG: ASCH domain-containing protein [bacterium]